MKSHYEIVNDLEAGCQDLEKYSELCPVKKGEI